MRWLAYLCVVLSVAVPGIASGPDEGWSPITPQDLQIKRAPSLDEGWLPVTPQDLQIKTVPGDPAAAALQLYYADYINYKDRSEFFYHRIKVLNQAGREYADVQITLPPWHKLKFYDLQARTILPDGEIVVFTGQPFEKVIVKGRGIKVQAEVFTLPQVDVGSIVEYKYKVKSDEYPAPEWVIQHDLFTVKEHFVFSYPDSMRLGYHASSDLHATLSQFKGAYELEMQNVAPFEREEHMPPEDKYRLYVRFLTGSEGWVFSFFAVGPASASVDAFVKPRSEIKQAAAEAVGNETDPEKKLRKLYARAQQVRNLSYERVRTELEQKKEQLHNAKNAAEVLNHGYGDRYEITLLFVALARAAGFNASVLLVVGRRDRLFDNSIPLLLQTDSEIALVYLNGRRYFLDPGTRFCPYGLLRWMRTATTALELRAPTFSTVLTPSPIPGDFMISRTADMVLSEDGSMKGTLIIEYRMGEALERRLEALHTDEAGRARQLEDELKAWLPADAVVKLTRIDGWDSSDTPLVATFDLRLPSYAAVTGKRLLMPVFLFQAKPMYSFTASIRRFPVYFQYAFTEIDTFSFTTPPGFEVETAPVSLNVLRAFGEYSNIVQLSGKDVIVQRSFVIRRLDFPPNEYPDLKGFFAKVREGDQQQAVLRPLTAATQQTNH